MVVTFTWVALGKTGETFGTLSAVVAGVLGFTFAGARVVIARGVGEIRGTVAF